METVSQAVEALSGKVFRGSRPRFARRDPTAAFDCGTARRLPSRASNQEGATRVEAAFGCVRRSARHSRAVALCGEDVARISGGMAGSCLFVKVRGTLHHPDSKTD